MFTFLIALALNACEYTTEAVLKYEKKILSATAPGQIDEPLMCMLEIQEKGQGMTKYLAASSLRPLLGGDQVSDVIKDARYARIATLLERIARHSPDVRTSVVGRYAEGDWGFYKLFCEEGNTEFCASFLPDEDRVRAEKPLLAAASMMRLRKAYGVLKGPQREAVGTRLKNLYKQIPAEQVVQRKFIDQIYNELFGMKLSSLA